MAVGLAAAFGEKRAILAKDKRGRPYFPGSPAIGVSISHCEGLIAAAVEKGKIGIDAERIRPFDERLLKRVCSPEEQIYIEGSKEPERAFFEIWTLKESYCKMMGKGLAMGLRSIEILPGPEPKAKNDGGCAFQLIRDLRGFAVAVCIKKPEGSD